VASVLAQLGVQHATVVGHSLGFSVATALASKSPLLVSSLVDIDQAPDADHYGSNFPLTAELTYWPLLGPALWRLTPDFMIRSADRVAFAPGYSMASGFTDPDQPVHDVTRMTYTAYSDVSSAEEDYTHQMALNQRLQALGKPLLVIFGARDQLYDAAKAANAYKSVPGAQIQMIQGAGHSPNVEKPQETASLILEFAANPNNPAAIPAKPEFKPPNKH
jgi:pimeloyl-ACP methyl ester carboxylesterase